MHSLTFDELLAVLKCPGRNHPQLVHDSDGICPRRRASEVCGLKLSDLSAASGHRPSEGSLNNHSRAPAASRPALLDEVKAMRQWLSRRPGDAEMRWFPSQKGRCQPRSSIASSGLPLLRLVCRSENEILMF